MTRDALCFPRIWVLIVPLLTYTMIRVTFTLLACSTSSSTLKIEAVWLSITSVKVYWSTRCHIPEDSTLYTYHHENSIYHVCKYIYRRRCVRALGSLGAVFQKINQVGARLTAVVKKRAFNLIKRLFGKSLFSGMFAVHWEYQRLQFNSWNENIVLFQ
jgi:hypothetical protein